MSRAVVASAMFTSMLSTSLPICAQSLAEPAPAKTKASETAFADATQPSRAQCLDAHRTAQELKQSAKFLEAQEHLKVCSSGTCPGAVITDCGSWISELEQITPSLVFEIRLDGKEAFEAKVFVDGSPVADRAHAVKLNPGRHSVRVELPPFEAHEEDVVLPEGQRLRLISVEFATKQDPPPAVAALPPPVAPKETVRPTPVGVYPLLALGVAGLGSFGVFSYLGKTEQDELEQTCSPNCRDDDLTQVKRWYMIGDISAGVGAAALIGATIVYLARPSKQIDASSAPLSLGVGSVGLGRSASGSFGINATRVW